MGVSVWEMRILITGWLLLGMIQFLWEVSKILYKEVLCEFCDILIGFYIIGFGRGNVLFIYIYIYSVEYGLRKTGDDFLYFFLW